MSMLPYVLIPLFRAVCKYKLSAIGQNFFVTPVDRKQHGLVLRVCSCIRFGLENR